jgi:mannose-6-phosphate isomerase
VSAPFYAIGCMRVRRGYRGGALLEARAGRPPIDSDRPEDWIASTVTAVNPGLPPERGEGLTPLTAPDGTRTTLAAVLGGQELGFLAKLLDSAMRLHVQAHPTRAFARERLGSPYGKLEAYVILAVRPGADAWIRLGFQRSPGREAWRGIVERQDVAAMDACFDRIPVAVGETWLVPGGWPHAIGPGVLMLEVMEPSDLVVRCEFEREGLVVPPQARFMGRDLDFCLDVFDYTQRDADVVRTAARLSTAPQALTSGCREQVLVGPPHTDCFAVRRIQVAAGGSFDLRHTRPTLVLAESGTPVLHADGARLELATLGAALLPGTGTVRISGACSLLVVQPG